QVARQGLDEVVHELLREWQVEAELRLERAQCLGRQLSPRAAEELRERVADAPEQEEVERQHEQQGEQRLTDLRQQVSARAHPSYPLPSLVPTIGQARSSSPLRRRTSTKIAIRTATATTIAIHTPAGTPLFAVAVPDV